MDHHFDERQTLQNPRFEFFHSVNNQPPNVSEHCHLFYEVLVFLSGNADYYIEGKNYQLRPGDVLLIPKGQIHRALVKPGRAYERYVLWVTEELLSKLSPPEETLDKCFRFSCKQHKCLIRPGAQQVSRLQAICRLMESVYPGGHFGDSVLMQAYLMEFLVFLNQAYFDSANVLSDALPSRSKVGQVVRYIGDNLTEPLSLATLSRHFFISPNYMNACFKVETGLTVYAYIIKKRLMVARELLFAGRGVVEAAHMTGFNDYSSFLKAFKREFGQNPRQYVTRTEWTLAEM